MKIHHPYRTQNNTDRQVQIITQNWYSNYTIKRGSNDNNESD